MRPHQVYTVYQTLRLLYFAVGRALLLGDAAHATTPDFASGAGLAIESTYFLGHIIFKVLEKNLAPNASATTITKVYDEIRRPFCNAAAAASRTLGTMSNFTVPGFEQYIDGVEMPRQDIMPNITASPHIICV
ncbi:hypothetical protein D9613_011649 [Agrocybe pediades]|uniref:FAD-binding domain-containing protein n=1 Tax=Agrocybe pediades TaxID=84607 RepID=A0A8H4VSC3_9AGAR|nr:hypothetical protein D9613_011649 [Agrocybe pediades]